MGLEEEIESAIIEELAATWIRSEFLKEVEDRLDDMIGVGDDDHAGLPKVANSLSNKPEVHIEPLDDFTKVRRRAYKALNQDLSPEHQEAKDDLLDNTSFDQNVFNNEINITISNNSFLMEDYMSGRAPSFATLGRDQILKQAFAMKKESFESGDSDVYTYKEYLFGLAGVKNYISASADLRATVPIRDFLRAAVQNMSKDDLVEFYKNAAFK
jgi:hypothetical protein